MDRGTNPLLTQNLGRKKRGRYASAYRPRLFRKDYRTTVIRSAVGTGYGAVAEELAVR